MSQQQIQCTSPEVFSGEALWARGDEQWEWTEDSFWSFMFPEELEGMDACLFNENPSVPQAHAFTLLSGTCQQTSSTTEPTGYPHMNFQDYNSLPEHLSTATTQSDHKQQAHCFSFGSPTHSQTPSLGLSPILSQDSPHSVEFLATPPTMALPYIQPFDGDAPNNGLRLQNAQVPVAFIQEASTPTADGLMGDPLPEDPQAHFEISYKSSQYQPTPSDQPGYSPKVSARQQRRKEKPEKCPIPGCGKGHAYKAELDRHIRAQHKDQAEQHALSAERFSCPHCPRDFARKDHLTRHRQRRHGLAKQEKRRSKKK